MKNTIIGITIIIGIIMFIGLCNSWEAHYTKEVEVIRIDNQEITTKDKQGNIWIFTGTDYNIKDKITITLYDNHTSIITDDIITKVKR